MKISVHVKITQMAYNGPAIGSFLDCVSALAGNYR
jgi:hypothetical protein